MTTSAKSLKIDDLMEQATEALSHSKYFQAEHLAASALATAHSQGDYDRMARILLPLQEARRQRLQKALDVGKIRIVAEPFTETTKVAAGCHLVGPPLVGAEARKLRLAALEQNVPVAVLCHEPMSRVGLLPIVAIAPGVTVRTKVRPPRNLKKPDLAWFADSLEALGDAAIQSVDPGIEIERRIDAYLIRLDAVPDHELLHQTLMDLCRKARHLPKREPAAAATSANPDEESNE
jgi:hypothetical protein